MSPSGWHILGVGAIGGLYATGLAAAGVPVTVLTRDTDSAAVLMREGLTVEEPDGHELHARPLAEPVVAGGASIRRLLVVTKAQDTVAALELIAHRLGPETRAVLLQNGMGTADAVHARFPRLMTVIGTTTNAAYRSTPRRLVRARRGETWIGDGPLPLPVIERHILSEALAESGLHAAWDNDLKLRLWHKLVLNCAVNPVTALLDVPNGVLAGTGPARTLVAAVCIEAAAVMQAEGLPADARTLIEQVVRLAHESGRNVSSMRADVHAGRTTEIDFINGYLLARAQAHGLQAPCNRTLTELIRLRTATAGGAA